jgi:hypothetical protein
MVVLTTQAGSLSKKAAKALCTITEASVLFGVGFRNGEKMNNSFPGRKVKIKV